MTDDTNTTESPFGAIEAMQRSFVDQSQRFAEESARAPAAFATAMRSAAGDHAAVHRRTIEVGQRSVEEVLDAIEATTPVEESALEDLRGAVDEGFEDLLSAHETAAETADAAIEDGVEAYEAAIEDAFASIDAQIDLVLDGDLDGGSLDAAEAILEQYDTLLAEIERRSAEFPEELREQRQALEDRLETFLDAHRSTLAGLESQFEDLRIDGTDTAGDDEN
ncbi:MAG: hypothetical protein ACOCZC_03790 [Halodesulfurarchaeum sp.]